MKKLHFTYEMEINYSEPVAKCNYTIKCVPKDNKRQKVMDYQVDFEPETKCCEGVDGLGNIQLYGLNDKPHKQFRFTIKGTVISGLSYYEEVVDDSQAMIFKHPHGLNVPGEGIKKFYEDIKPNAALSVYERAMEIMQSLHNTFQYQSLSTTVDTTAEEAFNQGHGVCQDYAHIFISLLQLDGIPARYVTGFIVGEGASHAWVELIWNGKWYGFDPTNNKVVTDEHIKIGVGRDAKDCTINRGIMHGGGAHGQIIKVSVVNEEIKNI